MSDFSVYFTLTPAAIDGRLVNSIYVWPVEPNWNDFGFGYQAQARIRSRDDQVGTWTRNVDLLVIPWPIQGQNRFDRWLATMNLTAERTVDAASLNQQFITILRNEHSYQDLVAAAGREGVERILRPLHDAVYYRWKLLETELLESFINSADIHKSVFRRESTYLAWHRGARILASAGVEEYTDARVPFAFSTKLPGFDGPHHLRIGFDAPAPLSDRCHALIGRNGVGKSQLLRELVITIGRRIDGTQTDPFTQSGAPRGEATQLEGTPNLNRVVVASWDDDSAYPHDSRLDSNLQYLFFPMTERGPRDLPNASLAASEKLTSQLLQIFRDSPNAADSPFTVLRTSLRPILDIQDLGVLLRRHGQEEQRWITMRELRSTMETRQLELLSRVELSIDPTKVREGTAIEMSSGERAFLRFGIRCISRLKQGSLLILDEPETHLHPNLIAEFMRILTDALKKTNSIALIATHSPFVARELPSRCVHVIQLSGMSPETRSSFLRTFGASIDSLSTDIFADADAPQVNQNIAEEISRLGLSIEEITSRFGREVSPEVLSDIRQRMRSRLQ